jgi:CheY-like chemotaxis protein
MVDLNMPVQDGRSVIKELKGNAQTKDIPLVVLSTTKNADDIQSVYNLGANDFFTKPSSFAELVTITQTILSKWLQTDINHE